MTSPPVVLLRAYNILGEWMLHGGRSVSWETVEEAVIAWARARTTQDRSVWNQEMTRYREFSARLPYELRACLFPPDDLLNGG